MKTAVDNFKAAVDAAITKAKADCVAGIDPTIIKQAFHEAMKAGPGRALKAREDMEKLRPQLEALKKTRNEAIKKAKDDFKTALEAAKAELNAAFGQ